MPTAVDTGTHLDRTHLDHIVARTRADLALRKSPERLRELERRAADYTPRGFAKALRLTAQSGPAVIAELKKASPSKGLIRADFNPTTLSQSLQKGGAACLSVLTDEPFFQGSLQNLELASAAVTLPCLRKDFIVDEFQIIEARACHADAILLIVAALTDAELKHLREAARLAELDVLCEVHTRSEIDRALALDCELYGVNSRDLRTFKVDPLASMELVQHLPPHSVRVAESGMTSHADIERMSRAGFNAFLIGESLMRQPDAGRALEVMLEEVRNSHEHPEVSLV